jgi:hypothetical protein
MDMATTDTVDMRAAARFEAALAAAVDAAVAVVDTANQLFLPRRAPLASRDVGSAHTTEAPSTPVA